MKKTVAAALAAALTVGVASTTFAAANPFSDVPANHWSYDAVTELAGNGIIEGYGDGTYRGDRQITRYEMAKIIAKMMAQAGPRTGSEQAILDKLRAEFAPELESLGVRVSELEKHADKVRWNGELRYRYWSFRNEKDNREKKRDNRDQLQLRLFPTAEVNDHWDVKARLTASMDLSKDTTSDVTATYVYALGHYNKFNIRLGKQDLFSDADSGLVVDDFFSGARLDFGSKLKVRLEGGRWNIGRGSVDPIKNAVGDDESANYQGIELDYAHSRVTAGAAFRRFGSDAFKNVVGYSRDSKEDAAKIFSVGLGYKFGSSVKLSGAYARNTAADYDKSSHFVQLDYKGANQKEKGSWGVFAAYRYLSTNVSLAPTFDTAHWDESTKGWDFGVSYAPVKNSLLKLGYFHGKHLSDDKDAQTLYARASLFF